MYFNFSVFKLYFVKILNFLFFTIFFFLGRTYLKLLLHTILFIGYFTIQEFPKLFIMDQIFYGE